MDVDLGSLKSDDERARPVEASAGNLGDGLKDVERARADIAINDPERGDDRRRLEPIEAARMTLLCFGRQAQGTLINTEIYWEL